MRFLVVALATAALALAACGGDDDRSDRSTAPATTTGTTTPPATQNSAPKIGSAKFSGRGRRIYLDARHFCALSFPSRVARKYNALSSDPVDAAVAYSAQAYRPRFQQAALEGCLAGF
jgi:hypothetical protein